MSEQEYIDPQNWDYVTTQSGHAFYRTGYERNGWPVFAKRLKTGWRAFEACHRAIRWHGITIDGRDKEELIGRIISMLKEESHANHQR